MSKILGDNTTPPDLFMWDVVIVVIVYRHSKSLMN